MKGVYIIEWQPILNLSFPDIDTVFATVIVNSTVC